jgi:hypothetical protein
MSEETNQEQAPLTKEEIAQRRQEITNFYKESIEHLKIQKEYEDLLLGVEEARAKRIQIQIELARFYAGQNESSEAGADFERAQGLEEDLPQPKRTLKRTE